MAATALRLVLLVCFITIVHSRILRLNSSDEDDHQYLISDGVDHDHHFESESTALSGPESASTCDHMYGFFPCAENIPGYIFLILVYQGLLYFGQQQIDSGSKVLFSRIGAGTGKIGSVIFRILMALPPLVLITLSGVLSSKENAQSQVSVGIGIYAGMTVFSLTFQWGICVVLGRRNLVNKSNDIAQLSNSNCLAAKEKLVKLKDEGVKIDKQTRSAAGIMLLSLIPYVVVELVDIFNASSAKRIITLLALIVSSLSLISYFIYQILDPWVQERSLAYSKYDMLRRGFLKHLEREGQLVNEHGKLNTDVIQKIFDKADKNDDESISKREVEGMVREMFETVKVEVEKNFAVSRLMEILDSDASENISLKEFTIGCQRLIDETKQSSENNASNILHELIQEVGKKKSDSSAPLDMDRIKSKLLKHAQSHLLKSQSLITPDGKPDIERIQTLFKKFDANEDKSISRSELKELISTVGFGSEFQPKYEDIAKELFRDFDKDENSIIDETEFVDEVSRWVASAISAAKTRDRTKIIDEYDQILWKQAVHGEWTLPMSLFQVSLGILITTILGGPLMTSILQLSYAMGLQSFSISFVMVPLTMNARALLEAILPAKQKNQTSASLTFSEIYGGVIMSNISGLTTLLIIIYAKELTWDFSAEVLTILVVCAVIGFLAYRCNTYPLWTCILAFLLYPLSLGFYYFAQAFLKWN